MTKMTREKKTFFYTVIIGILTHAFRMTNTMICSDTTNYFSTISPSWVTSLGRYLLPVVESFRGKVELPWLVGLISLVFIGFAAVYFVKLFDIEEEIFLVITAWIFSANPVVTSIFAYMYTSDGYMIALFFAVLAVYLCLKREGMPGILAGSICLAVSLGFYQAFISVTILLMLFWLFRMMYTAKYSMKEIGKTAGRCLLSGILGVIVYVVILMIVWKIGGYQTTSYMGIDTAGSAGSKGLLQAAVDCYVDFARFYLVRWEIDRYNVMNVLMFLLTGVTWLYLATKRKLWKMPVRVICMALLFPLLPFVCHIFEFVSAGVSYTSTSMEYSLTLIYLLLLIMWGDMKTEKGVKWLDPQYWKKNFLCMVSLILLLCISFHFTVIANRAYYNMANANTKVEMLLNRLVTRMEMEEGYSEEMDIAIFGSCYEIPKYVPAAPMMSGVVSNIFITQPNEYINMMNHYLSTDYGRADFDTMKRIAASEEFAEMDMWPSVNSIKVIDGVMVLYLSDTGISQYFSEE